MTYNTTPPPPAAPPRGNPLGLSILALIGLAALGVPRVILHDLHLIDELAPVTWLLALGPIVAWAIVAVVKKVPNPFVTVLVIGAIFGVMLVITHQLLWQIAFADVLPSVGAGSVATVIPRLAAIPSGLFVGAAMGAVGGLLALGIRALTSTPTQNR